jgi:hypothetical protein
VRAPSSRGSARHAGVARQLATDRRWAAAQPGGDRADRLTAGAAQRDLLTLGERQTAALQIAPAAWPHATRLAQPRQAAMAVRAGDRGRIGEELASLQRGPERLDHLGDQRIGEPHTHKHPPPA